MSEYTERNDLIRRTLLNYNDHTYTYDVTRLLEVICFCLILLKEETSFEIPSEILRKVRKPVDINSQSFIRHMRNSFCHLHYIDSILAKDASNDIENITFEDEYKGKRNFNVTLSVQDLKTLIGIIKSNFE